MYKYHGGVASTGGVVWPRLALSPDSSTIRVGTRCGWYRHLPPSFYELLGWPMKKFITCSQTFAHTYTLKILFCLRAGRPGSRRRNSPIPPHRVCTLFRFVGVRSTPLYEGSFAGGENKQLTYAQATVWGVGKEVPSSLSLPPFFLWVNSVRRVTGRQVREGHLPSPN